ncbi:hypothetical protein IWW37_005419 [Coemansia sp. RSA 2050]|nr:hypothetical protein IWW37_005419 [Coemansia sp. RSA 2050]
MEVSSASTAMPALSTSQGAKEPTGAAAVPVASSKLPSPEKKKKDFSRPVSTSSGNSMVSAVETQESSSRMVDSHDSLSTMPTPRNTFLYPPTGINLADKGSAQSGTGTLARHPASDWDSDQHQRQLQLLLEQRGIPGEPGVDTDVDTDLNERPAAQLLQAPVFPSYDDSYCLLNQSASAADGPESREAAVVLLQRLAASLDRTSNSSRRIQPFFYDLPSPLAPPLECLEQLDEALSGIMARRQVPNRTHVYHNQRSSAGSLLASSAIGSAAASAIAAGKAARRRQRMSLMSAGQDSSNTNGGADDKNSMRSRTSVASGDIAGSLSSSTVPYADLNGHMERLAACISRLQPTSLDSPGGSIKAGSTRTTSISGSTPPPQPQPQPPLPANAHKRQSSVSSTGAKSLASTQSVTIIPLTTTDSTPMSLDIHQARANMPPRLSPVTEYSPVDESGDIGELVRPRSSSHASVVSGKSAESRRRIAVTEVPTSAQYPNLFGSSVLDDSHSDRNQAPHSPTVAAPSVHSGHSESSYSNSSSSHKQQQASPPPMPQLLSHRREPSFSHEFGLSQSVALKPTSRSSVIVPVSAPAISVRDITPASRLALWLTMHSTLEATKSTLWRRKQWQRRFAIFAGNVIYLFKSSAPAATALSVIRLSSSTIVCVNDSFQGRSWVIEITQIKPADTQPTPPTPGALVSAPLSWYLQTEMRNEMIALLKQLKAAVNELQVQPDLERREEERLRSRRKKQRKEAKNKTDVCPWEVDEFSDRSSDPVASEGSDDNESLGPDDRGVFRIPDDELFPSDDDYDNMLDKTGDASGAAQLDSYSMGGGVKGARPTMLKTHDYTGTGGIAEWGAHRLQMPYNPVPPNGANVASNKVRSFSVDPAATVSGRRPSLADALAPPISAMQEYTPIAGHSPTTSPKALPQAVRSRSAMVGFFSLAARNSMMLRSDASALIDQMFASASRELSTTTATTETTAASGGNLFVVREEE